MISWCDKCAENWWHLLKVTKQRQPRSCLLLLLTEKVRSMDEYDRNLPSTHTLLQYLRLWFHNSRLSLSSHTLVCYHLCTLPFCYMLNSLVTNFMLCLNYYTYHIFHHLNWLLGIKEAVRQASLCRQPHHLRG